MRGKVAQATAPFQREPFGDGSPEQVIRAIARRRA
jgi:hypothetical protein